VQWRGRILNAGERLAKYAEKTEFSDFCEEIIEKAKYLILDSIGCALGAVQTELGRNYIELAKHLGGNEESSVIGDANKVSCMNAANANTHLADLLDFDDTYDLYPPYHPGCTIVPSALALGETVKASGKELLTAVILGYEVSLRVGRAAGSLLWSLWPSLSTLSKLVGPATAACRLLNLDREAFKRAFDILESGSGRLELAGPKRIKHDIPKESVRGSVKSNYGLVSLRGILAARQAQKGLTGMKGLLDTGLRTWYLIGGKVDNYDELTKGLGESYRIMDMSFKPTPSCRLTHLPITAAWQALEDYPIKAEEIAEITVKGVERLKHYEWETMLDAQFSTPCALAMAISGGEPGPRWYTTGRFKDADIRELASKVKFEYDPQAEALEIKNEKLTGTMVIRLKSGKVKKAYVEQIKGAPDNPMSEDELRAKFRANASSVIGDEPGEAQGGISPNKSITSTRLAGRGDCIVRKEGRYNDSNRS
jgi:2-methylcitrate dehydratase PrpD